MCKGNYYCISSKVKHHTSKASHELENLLTEILNYKATLLKTSKYWYSPTANLVCKEEKSKYNARVAYKKHSSTVCPSVLQKLFKGSDSKNTVGRQSEQEGHGF